jgi:hypothetical protein
MNPYLKCLISFFLGGLCIYLGSTMSMEEQKAIVYFLYLVGLVNIYIGIKDLAFILKSKK